MKFIHVQAIFLDIVPSLAFSCCHYLIQPLVILLTFFFLHQQAITCMSLKETVNNYFPIIWFVIAISLYTTRTEKWIIILLLFKLFTYCSKKTSVFFHGSTATKESNNGNNCSNTYDENGACNILHRWKIHIITNLQVDIDSHTEQPNTTKLKREKENFCSIKLAHTWKIELLRKLWFSSISFIGVSSREI